MTADSPFPVHAGPTWFDLRGMVELAMHNTRQLFELQFDVWRALMETQARAVASLGVPAAYGAVLCGGTQRPWSLAVRSGFPPWLPHQAGAAGDAGLAMERQFGALFGGPASLAAQGWQQAMSRCVAQADAAMHQWWEIAEQQVEELGDAAEAGRDALLDATDPASDPARAVEEVPDAAGAKPRRRVAGERSGRGRTA